MGVCNHSLCWLRCLRCVHIATCTPVTLCCMRCVRCVEIVTYRVQRTERLRCVGCVWLVTFVAFRSLRTHRLRCVACVAFVAYRSLRTHRLRCVVRVAFVMLRSIYTDRNVHIGCVACVASVTLRWVCSVGYVRCVGCIRIVTYRADPFRCVRLRLSTTPARSVKDCQKKLNFAWPRGLVRAPRPRKKCLGPNGPRHFFLGLGALTRPRGHAINTHYAPRKTLLDGLGTCMDSIYGPQTLFMGLKLHLWA